MQDIAEFLRRHPPFEELDADSLESLADAVEIEYLGELWAERIGDAV